MMPQAAGRWRYASQRNTAPVYRNLKNCAATMQPHRRRTDGPAAAEYGPGPRAARPAPVPRPAQRRESAGT